MGTEIHSKTYFSGSYSMRDLNDSASSGIWALYHQCKTPKKHQYYDSFLTRPAAIDGYLGNDKEQLRQTILKHESIFRHQLAELHRLYRRQRDLMNEIKRRELHQHLIPTEMSQPSLLLSHTPSEHIKKSCHVSDFPFVDPTFGRTPTSGIGSVQSPLSFMKENNISSPFYSQDRVTSKDCESPESKHIMVQRRLLNLELPASVLMNNEGKWLEESSCDLSGMESCHLSRNREVACEREVDMSLRSGLSTGCNGNAFRSNLDLGRTRDMVDLNEPVRVEEAAVSASVDNLGKVTCLDEEIQGYVVFMNPKPGFHILSEESAQSSFAGRDRGICLNNTHSENGGNHTERLNNNNEAGQSRCNADSFCGGVCPDESPAPFTSLQVKPSKVDKPSLFSPSDKSTKEPRRRSIIFGVEISEENLDQSVEALHTPSQQPLICQSHLAKSESSFLSPWIKTSNTFSQDVLSVQENPCINTPFPSNRSPSSLMPSPEFVRGKMQFSCNSKSVPRAELTFPHDLCPGSQSDAKQLQACCSSVGYCFPNGINGSCSSVREQFMPRGFVANLNASSSMDVKSAKDVNSDVVSPFRFQNKVILQQNPEFAYGQRKHENPEGGLPWLKEKELAKVEPIKGIEDAHQMNPHCLANYSEELAEKTEMGKDSTSTSACDVDLEKIEVGVSPSNSKILGFPIFVPQTSGDLTCLSSPSKSSCLASNGNGGNIKKGLDHDSGSAVQLEVKDLVTEKGLGSYISGLRHHIDLNLCLNEDETPSVPSLPRAIVKIATNEIDLEAPAFLESETDPSHETDFLENQLKSPSKLPLDESKEHKDELDRVAAEAIIAMSSSDLNVDITCHHQGVLSTVSLHWFATVISSYEGDLEGELNAVSRVTDSTSDDQSIPDELDYFELMTLKLTETKVEEYCNKFPASQNQKDEETGPTALSKRPRRGQARRGRQRKDFQRDVLPGLISLSRHEVTEDLQEIEDLFKASGFTWQPSLARRNAAKNGRWKRRRRGSDPSPTPTVVCLPPIEQPIHRELALEEKTLTGWGKKTRRLPRQRCRTGNPIHVLIC